MLKSEEDKFDKIKLVDFNTCETEENRQNKNKIKSKKDFLSSQPTAIAPETIKDFILDNKSDVWSTGVVIYTLLFGTVPFNGKNPDCIFNSILNKSLSF